MNDFQHAVRLFSRRPLVTAIALIALAAGAGAAIAAFSVLDQVVLQRPALRDVDRLVTQQSIAPAEFHELQSSGAFESAAAWMSWNFDLTGRGPAERLRGVLASDEFFPTLGFQHAGIVISHRLWQRAFNGDRAIVGKQMMLDGDAVTIAGVMPADFAYPTEDTDVWTPLKWGVHFQVDDREGRNLRIIARLRRGVSVQQANAIAGAILKRPPEIVGLHEQQTRELRPTLLVVFAAAAAMLAIACANVVNLMLMVGSTRRRELATRIALGASVPRLVRQSVAEGTILGGVAAILGLGSALAVLRFAATMQLPISERALALSPSAVLAGAIAAWLAGVVAMVMPLLLVRANVRESHQIVGSGGRLRAAFVVIQIALTCALLVSGGALVKSFARLLAVPLGFDAEHVLTARVWLPRRAYDTNEKQIAYFESLRERLAALPGVEAAATIQDLPLRKNAMTFPITIAGRDAKAAYRVVGGEYFAAMRIPLLRGRAFNRNESAPVFIINRALAATLANPIGRTMRIDDGPAGTIVGVCGDVRQMGLDADDVPAVYQPITQKQFDFLRWSTIVLRTNGFNPRQLASIDPNVPLYDVITLDELLREEVAKPRVTLWLVAAFGATALAIALIGIGGVLSYSVALRTREIAVRLALGARPRALLRLVLGQAWTLVACGIAGGLGLAMLASPALDRLLFQVKALDATVYAMVTIAVLLATTIAALIPARRAARVDPAATLRSE